MVQCFMAFQELGRRPWRHPGQHGLREVLTKGVEHGQGQHGVANGAEARDQNPRSSFAGQAV